MAKSLVENLSEPFKAEKYDDTYRKELLKLLRAKAKTGSVPLKETDEDDGEVVDLMEALRESVARTKRGRSTREKKPATRRKKTAA
jgi:DNA end-binding protein Ku